jgi:hypothetical protein
MTNPHFQTNLEAWLNRAREIAKNYKLEIDPRGKKYTRVTMQYKGEGQTSVFCFINNLNGDVLKAETWSKPAKHARGNIFIIGNEGVGEYGANYLR